MFPLFLLLTLCLVEVQGRCECKRRINKSDGQVVVDKCRQSLDLFARDDKGDLVLDDQGIVVLNDRYFCAVEASGSCRDKVVEAASQEFISYEACHTFLPPPGDPLKNSLTFRPGCGPGPDLNFPWKSFEGGCYKLFREKMTWYQAEQKCHRHLAHLVSITSAAENEFVVKEVFNRTESHFWVGGRSVDGGRDFTWSDGKAWNLEDWTTKVPPVFLPGGTFSASKTGGSVTATLTHDGKLNTAISLEEKSKIIQILLDSMGINYTLPAVQNEADTEPDTEPDLQILPGVTIPVTTPAAPADLCVQGRDPWYAASCEEELPFVCEY